MPETEGNPEDSKRKNPFPPEVWDEIQRAVDRTGIKAEQEFLLDREKFTQLWVLNEKVVAFSQTPEMMALEEQNTREADLEWGRKMDEYSRQLAREHGLGEDEIITFQQYLGETFMEQMNKPSAGPEMN